MKSIVRNFSNSILLWRGDVNYEIAKRIFVIVIQIFEKELWKGKIQYDVTPIRLTLIESDYVEKWNIDLCMFS